jgi:hypothetical protein
MQKKHGVDGCCYHNIDQFIDYVNKSYSVRPYWYDIFFSVISYDNMSANMANYSSGT